MKRTRATTAYRYNRTEGCLEEYPGWTARELSRVLSGTCFNGVDKGSYILSDGRRYSSGQSSYGLPKALATLGEFLKSGNLFPIKK